MMGSDFERFYIKSNFLSPPKTHPQPQLTLQVWEYPSSLLGEKSFAPHKFWGLSKGLGVGGSGGVTSMIEQDRKKIYGGCRVRLGGRGPKKNYASCRVRLGNRVFSEKTQFK